MFSIHTAFDTISVAVLAVVFATANNKAWGAQLDMIATAEDFSFQPVTP